MNQALSTTTERIDKDRVKLRVEVPEEALNPAIDAVYRRWAQEIKVPGFRKGKVPRRLIDAHVGPGAAREEAARDALPDLFREALRAEDLEAIAPPEIEVIEWGELGGGPFVFEATVDIRPEVRIPDLGSISVDAPPDDVTDQDVDEQIDRLRDRFAELETIGREVRRGDFVLIDIKGHRNDQLIEGMSAPDLLYEVGSHTGPPSLDGELEGNRPGAILKFTDSVPLPSDGAHDHDSDHDHDHDHEHAAQETDVTFTVLLKEVKTKKLPAADDEFAKTVGEFDTLEALKDDLRERLGAVKKRLAEDELRNRALAAVAERSDLEVPDKLVTAEFDHRLAHVNDDLRRAGLTLAEYARQTQMTELELRRDLRDQAERAVKAELLLEEIARDQKIDVTDEDLGRELAYLAARTGRDAKDVAQEISKAGRLPSVAADIMRRKALDYVVSAVNVVGRSDDDA
ncbi:MAG TPA: trigger factor [Actinomycetota bacterium]|nr:trigger factor [Actinomycetota bacterium]